MMISSKTIFEPMFNKAVSTIDNFVNEQSGFGELCKWMLTTDANSYSYLGEEYGSSLDSAEKFANLLHTLHHALFDDGDVEFVKVDGKPRIVFGWRHDDNFRNRALSSVEKSFEGRTFLGKVKTCVVEILNIEPQEFPTIYNEWWEQYIRRCFKHDAKRLGVDDAIKHYSIYSAFKHEWKEELL